MLPALALVLAFTVTASTLRGPNRRPPRRSPSETRTARPHGAPRTRGTPPRTARVRRPPGPRPARPRRTGLTARGAGPDSRPDRAPARHRCDRVRRMFAHPTQNWWWTASPAAH
ncbi:trp operon leader peptide [Streptomyces sp. Tu 3180]|nr:trp operon leader peptide [Streptomyces sp. Tu 3180]